MKLSVKKLEEEQRKISSASAELEKEKNKKLEALTKELQDLNNSKATDKTQAQKMEELEKKNEQLARQLKEEVRKSTELQSQYSLKNNAALEANKIMRIFKQENLERFVLDSCLLMQSESDMTQSIPEALKVLILCMREWQTFETSITTTFNVNLLQQLRYIIHKTSDDLLQQLYWLKFISKMIACFQLEFKNEVAEAIKKIQPFKKDFSRSKKPDTLDPPIFVSFADDSLQQQQWMKKQKKDIVNELINGLCALLPIALQNILEKLFTEMEALISTAVFQQKNELSFGITLTQLNNLYEEVCSSSLDPRIVPRRPRLLRSKSLKFLPTPSLLSKRLLRKVRK
jgi:hypothetical protein